MARDRLNLDWETYCDLDIKAVGVSRYTRHPSAEILMGAWSLNDSAEKQWSPAEGEPIPRELDEALDDPEVEKWAWNSSFEMRAIANILKRRVVIPEWRDTMVLAQMCSLPGKLEKAGPVVDLDAEHLKDGRGKRLMAKFSSPVKVRGGGVKRVYWGDAYSDWLDYLSYNRQDVVVERAIGRRLRQYMPPEHEWDLWHYDQAINEAGIPINMDMVRNAIRIYEHVAEVRKAEMRELAGDADFNPDSNPQLLGWLKDHGYVFDDMVKSHIKRAHEMEVEEDRPDSPLARMLGLRRQVASASIKKYYALERATDTDGLLRYGLQFAGAARTWRWAGRIWQAQNLPRPSPGYDLKPETDFLAQPIVILARAIEYLEPETFDYVFGDKSIELLKNGLRPVAQAPEGYEFVDADLNAIENRVLGWLADCPKILNVFRQNRDPYISFAQYLFDGTYDELMHEYKVLKQKFKRTIAKPGVLGCGYMLGAGKTWINPKTGEREASGLLKYAWDMQVYEFTLEQSKLSVDTFRREFSEVKDYWYAIEKAAKRCIRTGNTVEFGCLTFDMKGPMMRMILPSGRALHYVRPRIEKTKMPWETETGIPDERDSITYESKNNKNQWVRESTHPGKLTENADQAISRDILAHGMMLARKEGLDLRLHVHDQAVGLALKAKAAEALEILRQCMGVQPKWAPGLPLSAEGFTSPIFLKD